MYVKISNGAVEQYPYTLGNLRRDNSNTSFPKRPSDEMLADWGVYPVTIADTPNVNDRTQNAIQDALPTLVDGGWTLSWVVSEKTSQETQDYDVHAAEINRSKRSNLLSETDWWASSDLTMTSAQTAYRQALRDITSHANWPHLDEADWPTKP